MERGSLGYDINTGKPVTHPSERLRHMGNGYYKRECDITLEDVERKRKFDASVDAELFYKKLGFMEA